ncbi:fused MFS/spermidine synthase [Paenibacillus sp. IB182496]|uniref:Fused MFS/spermidine synthase n=1 Tax=Paenibacillus sabuli TaxID=2772509 RepID=A0A927GQX5_9BACL|nr:fused MFS/spermidine synthase [Paenibacillus sabuli]MBD2844833.1 fused MFS/spermidine synthase [Paenibacillus sabuli]
MELRMKLGEGADELVVYDTEELYGERGRFRVLQFSKTAVQGALDLDDPQRVVFEYTRAMLHLLTHNRQPSERVFMIGHGIGTIAAQLPETRVTTAELDPRVLEVSREWFGYDQDNVRIGDGRELLANEPEQSLDGVLLDAFDARGTPAHLLSRDFMRLARAKLAEGGLLIANLAGRGRRDRPAAAAYAAMAAQFAHAQAYVLPAAGRGDIVNLVLAASDRPIHCQGRAMAGFVPFAPEVIDP